MNATPLLWIEELRILRSWSLDSNEEIRCIKFRQGLNIVWADVPSDAEPELPGFGGHAAGKTSLCRLLRFVLGESHYGNRFMRDRILGAFGDGWVSARVWVDGTSWVVARAFATGHHPVALQTTAFESMFTARDNVGRFEDFRKALDEVLVGPFPLHEFPLEKERMTFAHLLQWLSRDQECRLSGLLDWRHESSNHGSPKMSAEQRRFMIRATLHLVDDLVRVEIEKRQPLEAELNRIPDEIAFERRNLQNGLADLRTALAPQAIPDVGESLFVDTVQRLAQKKRDKQIGPLDDKVRTLNLPNRRQSLNQLNRDLGAKAFQEKELQDYLDLQQISLKEAESDGTEAGYDHFWEGLKPTDQYCRIPISIARFRCPLRQEFEPDALGDPLKPDLADIAAAARATIQDLERDIAPIRNARGRLEKEVGELESQLNSMEKEIEILWQKRSEMIEGHTLTLFRSSEAVNACKRIEILERRQKELEKQIEKSQLTQEALQERQKKQISEFSELYETTVKAFLGTGVEASCRFTREEIALHAEYRGELSSAAIDTLKTLAFDIAAMRSSMFGNTHHPRFVILDSPREADMHPTPYRQIFHHLKSLESAGPTPPFQVILTTTEPPPIDLQGEPELVLRLDASKREERLFRTDF